MLKKNALASARVMPNGEIRIPTAILDALDVRPGDLIMFVDSISGIEIVKSTLSPVKKTLESTFVRASSQFIM